MMLLGLFNTRAYEEAQLNHDAFPWSNTLKGVEDKQSSDNSYEENFMILFKQAANASSGITFLMDGISLPLREGSFTTMELRAILQDPELKDKTKFVLSGEAIDIDEFLGDK